MRRILLSISFCFLLHQGWAQQVLTYEYAVKDTSHLQLDLYVPKVQNEQHACVVFVHGGGFINGTRNSEDVPQFGKLMNDHGFVFISIDYRLALRDETHYSVISGIKKFENAIDIAAEDLLSAVQYTLQNLLTGNGYTIDPKYIILCGSSAGAITVLQADYYLGNRFGGAKDLPTDFRFAGVMSFSGGIFSDEGNIQYRSQAPAPTLLCHGTEDRLVPYKKIQFFNIGMFGSNAIAPRFEKYDYPYYIRRYKGLGHQVAGRYNIDTDLVLGFIQKYVLEHNPLKIDETYYDPTIQHPEYSHYRIKDLKKFK